MTVRFDEALPKALALLDRFQARLPSGEKVLVRDLYGGLHLALDGPAPDLKSVMKNLKPLLEAWKSELGPFAPATDKATLFFKDEMFDPGAVFSASEKWEETTPAGQSVFVLDRQGIGQDWQRAPMAKLAKPAIAFYGLKGGVGRSTALVALAWWLGEQGKKVLIFDLDLESPGTTHLLSPPTRGAIPASSPRAQSFGIVDWLIEDSVGQADASFSADLAVRRPISSNGEVWIVPAHGEEPKNYLSKLSRAYLDARGGSGAEHFGERLHRLCVGQIAQHSPDVVLIDSRAGLHDIAAVAITHLASVALLFATASEQTWQGYQLLFDHWKSRPDQARAVREKLKTVASMIPETSQQEYLASLRVQSWETFSSLYDASGDADAFNFDLEAIDAPHLPLEIYWHRAFMEFKLDLLGTQPFTQAMGQFPEAVAKLAGIREETPR